MPIAFLAALAGSVAIHAAALFLPEVDLSTVPEAPAIAAEIQPPPRPPAAPEAGRPAPPAPRAGSERHRRSRPARVAAQASHAFPAAVATAETASILPPPEPGPAGTREPESVAESGTVAEPVPPATAPAPRLPDRGFIRFDVFKGADGFLVGRAEHRWEFADGRYRMEAVTETVGLAALVKPVRVELESRGSLTAGGLQPERFTTRRNGGPTNENADFDWESRQVILGRDGSRREVAEGAQDLLSFHYQFGYLPGLDNGAAMGVATGKKFENYRFETVGEENLDTPAGRFRTVHLRVRTDSTTELWLALDRLLLPVKIRYTDRKGDSFEQVATELGM